MVSLLDTKYRFDPIPFMMDNYHSNIMGTSNSPYSSLPGISPHQLQHNSNLPPHTLPPLQPQHAAMHSLYGSAPHTPRTPVTPNTPGSTNNIGGFPQMQAPPRSYQMMPVNNYQQQPPHYRASSSMMPQSLSAMSHPQPIAPAPSQNRLPQSLRPMPATSLQHMYGQSNMLSQAPMMQDLEAPTHVVGSQGRRGILPSAPGRPAVTATGTGSTKNAMIPAKDADGKFPCPHCTKTYLHAKHLKRHLLRHTGDRPYMCVLCRDTFSRSDILKRHFQKCSIRRGNPTGASHLSHAQAHLKKSHPGPHKSNSSMSNENDLMAGNGMSSLSNDPGMHPYGVMPDGSVPDVGSKMMNEQAAQAQLSRSNSLKHLGGGGGRDGRSMAGPLPGGSNRGNFDQSYAGAIASTMPSGMNPSLAFSMPNGQNGHSYSQGYDFTCHGNGANMQPTSTEDMSTIPNGRTAMPVYAGAGSGQSGLDWSQMFQPGVQDGFMGQYNQNIANTHLPIKAEPSLNNSSNGIFTGVYQGATPGLNNGTDFPFWNLGSSSHNDPLQDISNRLLYLCFPPNSQISGRGNEFRKYLSADNIKHFFEHFANVQAHFPFIHFPTFRIAEAYDGLLLAITCLGAAYSDRLTPSMGRELMELAKVAIEENSQVFAIVSREQNGEAGFGAESIGTSRSEMEQVTALFLMQVLFIWHGTPVQREKARQEFPIIVTLARRTGLNQPMTASPFSILHQPNMSIESVNASNFDWHAWVEQETRFRLLYAIFVVDTGMMLYFNTPPILEALEIRIPLPSDDAAWDARTSAQCADTLGLNGPIAARDSNPEGSRRARQPDMHSSLKALMQNGYDLQPGSTNLYSKFILVHALHIQLWTAQKQLAQESGQLNAQNLSFLGSGTNTPIAQNDWVTRNIDHSGSRAPSSNNTSGRATPVEAAQQPLTNQLLNATNNAFDKWKKLWDEDMLMQYPPSSSGIRRLGICRDGVHFYWLAKCLVKRNRGFDMQIAPDQRFSQIIHLIHSVKVWVASDSAKRGEELGALSEIDSDYGVKDLTLDMTKLFKPINHEMDSPVKNIGSGLL